MPFGDGYHVIMAILLLPHEVPKDEPAQQHDVANSFSNRSDERCRNEGGRDPPQVKVPKAYQSVERNGFAVGDGGIA